MGQLPYERRSQTVLQKLKVPLQEPPVRTIPELLERGIVVIDKPSGPTSHQVSAYVQQILNVPKSGHSGTLDPGVTGVLPVALGKGTRIVQSLLTAGKEYVCLMHLHDDVEQERLDVIYAQFTGKIKQLPPVKSAVKRQWRFRKIYYIEQLDRDGREVLFKVGSQAGTYIRKLVSDMGDALGCGAHMAELRRTKVAGFVETQAVTLQDLTDAFYYYQQGDETKLRKMLLPLESGVQHLSKIWIHDSTIKPVCHGMQLKVPGIVQLENEIQKDDTVAVMTMRNELVLVGTAVMSSKEMLQDKGVAVKTEQVFMVV